MINKEKSVSSSKAGSTLETVSSFVLVLGILATILLFFASFHDSGRYTYSEDIVFDWRGLAPCLEVLLSSIFIYALGKTIAKIANYNEAIYKNLNPDYIHDKAIKAGAAFLIGDTAFLNDNEEKKKVEIKDYEFFEGRLNYYICVLPDGTETKVRSYNLKKE